MMIDKQFFVKYQKILVWLANSKLGILVFQFEKMGHNLEYGYITEIYPNAIVHSQGLIWNKKKKQWEEKKTAQFFSRNEYALKLSPYLFWLPSLAWETDKGLAILRPALACALILFAKEFLPFIFLTTDTFYPASGANSPVDGTVSKEVLYDDVQSLATLRGGTGTASNASGTVGGWCRLNAGSNTNNFYNLWRGFFLFNTSTIPDTATISDAVLSLYGTLIYNQLGGGGAVKIGSSSPASDSALAFSDYTNVGTTEFSSKALSACTDAGYNDFTLNASGIANISLSGNSKFSTQIGWDMDNNFGGTWGAGERVSLGGYFADNGTDKPKLVVTYTVVTSITKTLTLNYNLYNQILKTLTINWNLYKQISKTLIIKWNLSGVVTKVLTLKWHLLNNLEKNLTLKWYLFNSVSKLLTLKWTLFNQVTKNLILKWTLYKEIIKSLILKWTLYNHILKSLNLKWSLYEEITKTLILKYHLLNTLTKDIILKWHLFNAVIISLTLRWTLYQQITKNLTLKWNLLNTLFKTLIIKYHLLSIKGLFISRTKPVAGTWTKRTKPSPDSWTNRTKPY